MKTLKTVVVVVVLAIVGFELWQGLNNGFNFDNVPPPPDEWDDQTGGLTPPTVDLGNQQALGSQTIAPTTGAEPPNSQIPTANLAPFNPTYADHATAALPTKLTPGTTDSEPLSNAKPATSAPINAAPTNSLNPTQNPLPAGVNGGPNTASPTSDVPGLPKPDFAQPPVAPPINHNALTQSDAAVRTNTNADAANSRQSAFETAFASAQEQLKRGQLSTALLTLSIWYEDPRLSEQEHRKLLTLLNQLAGTVIYSTKPLLEPAYRVRAGDRLENVAQRYKVPSGLLAKINGISNPDQLTANQELKVINGPFNAVINTKKNMLTLFLGGRYAGRFLINCGPEFEGIIGQFVVKSKNRAHSAHNGFPWIELGYGYTPTAAATQTPQQIGLAGMTAPAQAVTGSVPGRIGVSARDAEDLFDILSQGSKVTIRR